MFQSVVFEMERVGSGAVRLTLLPAGVEEVGHSSHLKVGRLLHGVIVTNQNVPEEFRKIERERERERWIDRELGKSR